MAASVAEPTQGGVSGGQAALGGAGRWVGGCPPLGSGGGADLELMAIHVGDKLAEHRRNQGPFERDGQ